MMAFHLSWICFFMSFVATFAPASLAPVIRDDLFLTKSEVGNAGVSAVCGAIAARLFMGIFVDVVGEFALKLHAYFIHEDVGGMWPIVVCARIRAKTCQQAPCGQPALCGMHVRLVSA